MSSAAAGHHFEPPSDPVGTGVVDAALAPAPFDFSGGARWRVVVLGAGRPAAVVEMPAPGPGVASERLVAATLMTRATHAIARARLIEALAARIGGGRALSPELSVSVVVCTHGRPHHIPRLLSALSVLDPAPDETIVVDNAPGEVDCRSAVDAAGFRYVREDRRGLNNARNAGLRAASGEVVVFTDDDCVPSTAWLRPVPRVFEDPAVGGAGGPMFPYRLETHSQVLMEVLAGMSRGLVPFEVDWRTLSVAHGGAVGVGANMAFRRASLERLGEPIFPPELDAGTPTESGGDTYVLGRVLSLGMRLRYEPEMFGFHDHRVDNSALERAIRGYGIGVSAALCKLLVEDHELEALRGWLWLVHQYVRVQGRRALGVAHPGESRCSREYIVGGLLGPSRWRRSLRRQRAPAPDRRELGSPSSACPTPGLQPVAATDPAISVVIPSHAWSASLTRCLDSLAAQTVPTSGFEVLVVDDSGEGATACLDLPLPVRICRNVGRGASAARNLGAREARAPFVLFLDSDIVAEPDLLERHLARHRAAADSAIAVIGPYWPRPVTDTLIAHSVALWWNDAFEAMRMGSAPTFMWMLSGNLSVPREAFLTLGGFSDEIQYRREDWELGLRWIRAGHEIVYEPLARSRHEYSLRTADRLRAAELEGFGDGVLSRLYPDVAGSLPSAGRGSLRRGHLATRLAHMLLSSSAGQRASQRVLGLLENAKLRSAWLAALGPVYSSAYERGLERAGPPGSDDGEVIAECDLVDDTPLSPSAGVAPTLRIMLGGRELAMVRPRDGFWGPELATQVVDALDDLALEQIAHRRGWIAAEDPDDEEQSEIEMFPLRGSSLDDCARAEASIGFDGESVDVVFGIGVADDRPLQPLYLHDRQAPPQIKLGEAPAYIAARPSFLADLDDAMASGARRGEVGAALAIINVALVRGRVVGRRDIHGVRDGWEISPREHGRAWAAACGGASAARTTGWRLYDRGRLTADIAWEAVGAVEGVMQRGRRRR